MGDILGGVGTALIQLVLGQLLYAERHNLKPWVHFNNWSKVVYDPVVHGAGPGVTLRATGAANATYRKRPGGFWRDLRPGKPNYEENEQQTFFFAGTGIWLHYFQPVSDFVPGDRSCESKPLVTMGDLYLITPGLHGYDEEAAMRAWRYDYLPEYLTQPHLYLTEWLEPQRRRAHDVLQRYIRFRPYLRQQAQRANPGCSKSSPCLGLHIRHSDKAAGRTRIATSEFLPFAQAFEQSGGKYIYLATDSTKVLNEIHETWPKDIQSRIRAMQNAVRSANQDAVFDLAKHHRTNQEILVEILALSQCQFMIHSLSAVSEASIWINLDLHNRSVNLEDPDHIDSASFETLVSMATHGEPPETWPGPPRTEEWWLQQHDNQNEPSSSSSCEGYDGVLHIAFAGSQSSAASALFTHVLNQLLYADKFNLKPWIHLRNSSEILFDKHVHATNETISFQMKAGMTVGVSQDTLDNRLVYVDGPSTRDNEPLHVTTFSESRSNGIWTSYFSSTTGTPSHPSCRDMPLIRVDERMVTTVLGSHWSQGVRPWRFDTVPDHLWWSPPPPGSGGPLFSEWIKPQRQRAANIVNKYFHFLPFLTDRANAVNPVDNGRPCLAVHIRVGDKSEGTHRRKIKADQYKPYLEAFQRARGRCIYVATDSSKALKYMQKTLPADLWALIRTQEAVRTSKEWPLHLYDSHHRITSEVLVDILAMAKCQILLHTYSTVAEAAIYLNMEDLHEHSVNLEHDHRIPPDQFEAMARQILGAA